MSRALVIAVLLLLSAISLPAQYSERIDVVAVEVPITVRDRAGKTPLDLTKDDFEVTEGGEKQEVIGLSYPPAAAAERPDNDRTSNRWQIIVYVQESTSSTPGLRGGIRGVAAEAERIAALGDVEIVTDFPTPHVLQPPTGDASVLRERLRQLERTVIGRDEVQSVRRDYDRETRRAAMRREERVARANMSAILEASIVRTRQDAMLGWMSRYGEMISGRRRLLLYVSDGYPLEPVDFYVAGQPTAGDLADLRSYTAAPRQDELARTLGGLGWTILSIAPRALLIGSDVSIAESSRPSERRLKFGDTLDGMLAFKDETAGEVTTDVRRIAGIVDSFTQRLTLTYRARRRRDGVLRDLVIRSRRPGLKIESPRATMSATSESLLTARATSLALEFGDRGELPVDCRITGGLDETLAITIELEPLAAAKETLTNTTLRVAIGVAPSGKMPFQTIQRFDGLDLSVVEGWKVTSPIRNRGGAPTAVVVEELSTGAWGGARCERE